MPKLITAGSRWFVGFVAVHCRHFSAMYGCLVRTSKMDARFLRSTYWANVYSERNVRIFRPFTYACVHIRRNYIYVFSSDYSCDILFLYSVQTVHNST